MGIVGGGAWGAWDSGMRGLCSQRSHGLATGRTQDQEARRPDSGAPALAVRDPSQTICAHFWIFALCYSCFPLVSSLPLYYLHLFSSLLSSEKPFSFFQFLSPASSTFFFLLDFIHRCVYIYIHIYIWIYASPILKTKTNKPGHNKKQNKQTKTLSWTHVSP